MEARVLNKSHLKHSKTLTLLRAEKGLWLPGFWYGIPLPYLAPSFTFRAKANLNRLSLSLSFRICRSFVYHHHLILLFFDNVCPAVIVILQMQQVLRGSGESLLASGAAVLFFHYVCMIEFTYLRIYAVDCVGTVAFDFVSPTKVL
jgi:hypothetical protein